MYLPTSNQKKIDITTKTTSFLQYHTSNIQKISTSDILLIVYDGTGSESDKTRSSKDDETNNNIMVMNSASTASSNAMTLTVPINEDYEDDKRTHWKSEGIPHQ
ncbi:unnamed protein product [Rotaria sordida]|uniref:Uncharacterized protein n=1 Tax=Rotaria sordida TaxID=392033 RepID=A0A814A0J9_9BILA|nr:unnamed protein product [Rotaria sordida]CAF3591148.1 unnamed protein product [Rotaria sordida]